MLHRLIGRETPLTAAAREEMARDARGLGAEAPSSGAVVEATLRWLSAAQDRSRSADGGFARDYSLMTGWSTSYPETSGYIVPTMIEASTRTGDPEYAARARRCLDWLVSIQFPEGGFQGGTIGATPVVPVTFNTGQILLGLSAGAVAWGEPYTEPMHRAARWLVDTMDADGCWRRFATPFAAYGEKAYETHVSWGLIEAARAAGPSPAATAYADAALGNARWAMSHQAPNGWFDRNCLNKPETPLTHTIGYVLRGLVEIHALTGDPGVRASCERTADAIVRITGPDGRLAGRLDREWNAAVNYVCLTGSAQIAHALLRLDELGPPRADYRATAARLLHYVRRAVATDGPEATRGAVKGSFPVDGEYGQFQYLNWGAKFLVDACWAEQAASIRAGV